MTLRAGRVIAFTTLLIMLSSPLLITSCSNVKRDGAPSFHVDATKVPNATPKLEPLSKFGNMSSYKVKGQRYYPRKSSQNFEQVGIASWYGTLFHDRKTSSGEPYDMLGMTAAHKTLPLPTYVEVTNLKNQRKIIVRVNDRGPFESNRIIDLSYVAAKKLGMLGHGTTKVLVTAIDPTIYGKPILLAKNKNLYLHVATFRNRSHAVRLKERLTTLLKTPVKISYPIAKNKYYRVEIGPIKDQATAYRVSNRLKRLGIAKPREDFRKIL